ncbi:hypothetical protein EYF80_064839 [Liparis tanakae]
MAWRR